MNSTPSHSSVPYEAREAAHVTAAANAAWLIESSMTWNTIPPGVAVVASIFVLGTINWHLTAVLMLVVSALGIIIAWWAANGRELHQAFAGHAAHVSGDLTDIVSNIGLVRAFGAAQREQQRLSTKIEDEMQAQRASLRSLERLRQFHAVSVFVVTGGVLVWAIELWRRGEISTGDVVLTQGENVGRGTRLTIDLSNNHSTLESPGGGRPRVVIYQNENKPPKPAKTKTTQPQQGQTH